MRPEDCRQRRAKVGGDCEIAPLIQVRCGEPRPLTVDAATLHRATCNPDDIAVAVIGAAIAVFVHRPAELGEHDDDGVAPRAADPTGKRSEAFRKRAWRLGYPCRSGQR